MCRETVQVVSMLQAETRFPSKFSTVLIAKDRDRAQNLGWYSFFLMLGVYLLMLNFKSSSMIRSILIVIMVSIMFLLTGANYKSVGESTAKKHCKGYSVIEVDKGIDCNGDTIKLVKVNGFFQRAL